MKYPATERPVNNGTQWKRPVGDTLIINSFPRGFCASSAPSNHCQEALALMMMTVLMRDCRASFGTVAARPFLLAAAAHYRPLLIHLFRADRLPNFFIGHLVPLCPAVQIFKISRLTRLAGTHALLHIGRWKINFANVGPHGLERTH